MKDSNYYIIKKQTCQTDERDIWWHVEICDAYNSTRNCYTIQQKVYTSKQGVSFFSVSVYGYSSLTEDDCVEEGTSVAANKIL